MPFPDSFLSELAERNNIEDVVSSYIPLSRKSGSLFALCPFHNEKTPSFSVLPSRQIYHCFGCGKGGSVFNFIMDIENLSFPDAVHFLAARAGIPVPDSDSSAASMLRSKILELNRDAARFFNAQLRLPNSAAAAYLFNRGISKAITTKFGLGEAPDAWDALILAMSKLGYDKADLIDAGLAVKSDKGSVYDKFRNRLVLPVIDVRGNVIGFSARTLSDSEPKYLNSPETPVFSKRRSLFGINFAKNTKRPSLILCEGNIDVITLHQAGFDNAVASMGTALTPDQCRLIARYSKELIICFDTDEAGIKATDRAIDILKNTDVSARVLNLPHSFLDGKPIKTDADDFIRTHGAQAFEALLNNSEFAAEHSLAKLTAAFDLSQDVQRIEFIKQAASFIAKLPTPVEREIYGTRAANAAAVSPDTMMLEVSRAAKRLRAARKKSRLQRDLQPAALAQPAQKSIAYSNIRSAAAEEGIIRLLLLDPSLLPAADIRPDDFSSPFLAKVFSIIINKLPNADSPAISLFAQDLSPDEMSHLSLFLQKPENLSSALNSLRDYIAVIRAEKLFSVGDLLAIRENIRERKGYGG